MKAAPRRARRARFESDDDDPLTGVANLFDLAMVVGAALMIALVVRPQVVDLLGREDLTLVKNPGQADMEIIVKKGREVSRYKASAEKTKSAGGAGGKRIGTAYQLGDGRIVYLPDDEAAPAGPPPANPAPVDNKAPTDPPRTRPR